MDLTPHPQANGLAAGLHSCLHLAAPWDGTIFRFTGVKYANRGDLLSGAGARRHGGRWNPPGLFNCIYGSLDAGVAQEESFASNDRYGIPREMMRPLVQVAVRLRLQVVLDLTDAAILKLLGVSRAVLTRCDWEAEQDLGREAITQCLGRLAWQAKLEAVLVPSRQISGGVNLALFPGRRRRGSSWKIQGARDLPRK